jgi:DDE_Tnp_1-associated
MAPFSNLLAALADVPDPRRAQGKRYPLPYMLLFTVLALLSGANPDFSSRDVHRPRESEKVVLAKRLVRF